LSSRKSALGVLCAFGLSWAVAQGCAKIGSSGGRGDGAAAPSGAGGSAGGDAAAGDASIPPAGQGSGGQPAGLDGPVAPGAGGAGGAGGNAGRPDGGPCVGLQCQQGGCAAGTTTSISGTTFAPNGTLPLYNVMVYVPNAPLDPFTSGVSCDRCGKVSGRPVASAVSNAEGKFKIENAPAGKDIPLVLQVGKWRRKVTVPNVTACRDNPITDAQLTRLPRNRQEGDMPRIAVTTGYCDTLGCLLPKIGVDPAELGIPSENKAVSFYGIGFPDAPPDGPARTPRKYNLWSSEAELSKYDITMLSCECNESLAEKGAAAWDAVTKYVNKGGRLFGTDFMYVWYKYATDPALAGAMTIPGRAPPAASPIVIDTTFPKGKALADWMKFVEPTSTYSQIVSAETMDNFAAVMPGAVQVWGSSPSPASATPRPRILTVNTPVGRPADQQCGRASHIDAHIVANRLTGSFPASCGAQFSPGETAMAFLLFDLSACIQDDSKPVVPPPIIVE
jgi:hypothetical protein